MTAAAAAQGYLPENNSCSELKLVNINTGLVLLQRKRKAINPST